MTFNSFTFCLLGALIIYSCSKNEPLNQTQQLKTPEIPKPGNISLLQPLDNAICQGNINKEDTTLYVEFKWESARNATNYQLRIFDENGVELHSKSTKNTSLKIEIVKNRLFTWNVTAENKSGKNTSKTFTATTSGENMPNYIPSINAVIIDKAAQTITLKFQDQDGDTLFYDVLAADNSDFDSPTEYALNQQVPFSTGESIEHKVLLQNIVWTSPFWLHVRLRDQEGNQSVQKLSRSF